MCGTKKRHERSPAKGRHEQHGDSRPLRDGRHKRENSIGMPGRLSAFVCCHLLFCMFVEFQQKRWTENSSDAHIGDVILLVEKNTPRSDGNSVKKLLLYLY